MTTFMSDAVMSQGSELPLCRVYAHLLFWARPTDPAASLMGSARWSIAYPSRDAGDAGGAKNLIPGLRGGGAATFETHPIPRAAGTESDRLQMVFTANYDGYEVPGESAPLVAQLFVS